MDPYLLDWINFLLRWAHVIVAIAWIGSSFYFVFLDSSLVEPTDAELREKGVGGELWAVHGGGFYNPQKYLGAPRQLPEHLHWFYWESYSTFLTGFALFTAIYLFQADTFLIDPRVHAWTPAAAIPCALAFIVVFWLGYDAICRLFDQGDQRVAGALVALLVAFASWLACDLFAGRAAFVLVGGMLAASMSANVFFWIIPGQRKVIAQMKAGEPVDPAHGRRAKQRSVHNTYFTLPVLAAMLSNHYAFLHGAAGNWIVLVVMMAAGALIRTSFVARHRALVLGRRVPWEYAILGCALLVGLGVWLKPAPIAAPVASARAPAPTFAQVQAVVKERCSLCHNAQVANKGVRLDAPDQILAHAPQIVQQAVVLKAMPLNNATQITDAERGMLKRWYEAGAKPD
ncbi:urate hydroxylase PuuD [Scleromatobacter humisilvae]|uniref:Urate hydroxylase PuuD n=1 Tax=Scleromatobacter humisilvae TaxID=2897159 RepID=A0A9X1YJ01_9BURK|nr:urate hydroxylase PuuD [Scleromatobacter humisilvae]MCK9685618.1 urate hydroxylase PuuD [Scleromatobacter humisilvae]